MSSYSSLYKGGTPPTSSNAAAVVHASSGVLTPTGATRSARGQISFKAHGSQIAMATTTQQQQQAGNATAGWQPQQPQQPSGQLASQASYGALPPGYPTYAGYNPAVGSAAAGGGGYHPAPYNNPYQPPLMNTQSTLHPHYPMYPTYSPYGPPPPNPYAPVASNPYLAGGVLPPHPQSMLQHHPSTLQHAASMSALPKNPAGFVHGRPVSNPGTALASPSQTQPNSHRRSHTTASTKSAKGERSAQPSPPRGGGEEEVKAVRVRVIARVRPMLPHETSADGKSGQCVSFPASRTLQITLPVSSSSVTTTVTSPAPGSRSILGSPSNGGRGLMGSAGGQGEEETMTPPTTLSRRFEFDAVLDPSASQVQVFEQSGVKEYIDSALQGYAATVFAYGQTGSGSVTDTQTVGTLHA
jgi:hypothetical protein